VSDRRPDSPLFKPSPLTACFIRSIAGRRPFRQHPTVSLTDLQRLVNDWLAGFNKPILTRRVVSKANIDKLESSFFFEKNWRNCTFFKQSSAPEKT
jgi:hypothetical protein